jgi:hypothetical protein
MSEEHPVGDVHAVETPGHLQHMRRGISKQKPGAGPESMKGRLSCFMHACKLG